nr:MAG TPA: hypothetical protein [Caudoviricetes sp.]
MNFTLYSHLVIYKRSTLCIKHSCNNLLYLLFMFYYVASFFIILIQAILAKV